MLQTLPQYRPLPSEPLCGSQPEKDLGLNPDTNKHMSGFRILLSLQGS